MISPKVSVAATMIAIPGLSSSYLKIQQNMTNVSNF